MADPDEAAPGITVGDWLRRATRQLAAADCETPGLDARLLLTAATGVTAAEALTRPERALTSDQTRQLDEFLARRIAHEPVSRILGERQFWGRDFIVTPATLDPRPDTETLIEAVLELAEAEGWRRRPLRLLDVGTGTGCIAITLLAELPQARGVATDISPAALEIARRNAARHGVAARLDLRIADALTGIAGPFDILVSNPPYIPDGEIAQLAPDVRAFDPLAALDGGADGLDIYRALAARLAHVVPQGWVLVEVGAGQADAVAAIFTAAVPSRADGRAAMVRTWSDLGGHVRCVGVRTGQ